MVKYIERHASRKITGSKLSDIQGNSGIIVFGNCNWGDATGHVDLFNGTEVEGKAYWSTCGKITLYIL